MLEKILKEKRYIIRKDVAVIGGGPAGVGAALSAARNGARTVLIEKESVLGGQMTAGLVTGFHGFRIHKGYDNKEGKGAYWAADYETEQQIKGIPEEVVRRLADAKAAITKKGVPSMRVEYDPEVLKWIFFEMMEEAGVDLLLNSFAFGCIMAGDKIDLIRVANKSGEELLKSHMYVDASADGDIAAWAGASYEMGQEEDARCMATTVYLLLGNVNLKKTIGYLKENPDELHNGKADKWEELYDEGEPIDLSGFPKLISKAFSNGDYPVPIGNKPDVPFPIFYLHNSALPHGYVKLNVDMAYAVDITNAQDLSRAEVSIRMNQIPKIINFVKNYIPGFEDSFLLASAPLIGTRESRRIKGHYTLTEDDVLFNRKFKSVIARCGRAMNVHSSGGGKKGELRGGQIWIEPSDPKGFDIPYEILIPQGIENLLVSGRCVSTDRMALGSVRGEPVCMATGEAAGAAAALCVKNKVNPISLDINLLQKTLKQQGAEIG